MPHARTGAVGAGREGRRERQWLLQSPQRFLAADLELKRPVPSAPIPLDLCLLVLCDSVMRVSQLVCVFIVQLASYTGGEEEGRVVKRPRAPSAPDPDVDVDVAPGDQAQDLDERNGPPKQPSVPPGFLSPSVKEYLELGKSIPGRPGADYPILSLVPYTDFYCEDQDYPGFFADMDTRCQAWHYCDIDGRQTTFLCPNGTQFSQAVFVCDWWFNVRCDLSKQLYPINARLYRRPKLNPTRPHRLITKQLLDNIFV